MALPLVGLALHAQAKPGSVPTPPPPVSSGASPGSSPGSPSGSSSAPTSATPEKHITPEQAKELFASVDPILRFASDDSKLPLRRSVKKRLTNRAEVEHYVLSKLKEDKDTKRLERAEIVLKKFGLLDRDFQLQPFIISLLTEQIAGYYDSKTKTVNLLDWIAPEEQKPVLAHELTHALQDQHVDLEKWADQTIQGTAHTVDEDNRHLAVDEADTARNAVAEGQAMVVFLDWSLKPSGRNLATMPDVADQLGDEIDESRSSPILSRAPLLLKASLLFPYRAGLNFEQTVLRDQGPEAAFAQALDRPPASSYEIMNPHVWEQSAHVPMLRMPDIHPLLAAAYDPYDIGVMGELDVRILMELFGGRDVAAVLTPEWDGGLYYAAQSKRAATSQQKSSTASVSLFYLSRWKSAAAASSFADIYATNLPRKYTRAVRRAAESAGADTPAQGGKTAVAERIFDTEEGPVLIAVDGKQVFISESFDLETARKLQFVLTGAQSGAEQQVVWSAPGSAELTGSLRRMLPEFGAMCVTLPH
ncbi:MAG: hypothetical protein ACR2JE_05480 [Acidobacteriaceae bacterium]